jgi:periplasmic protein CpxP/Spy
MKLTKPAFLAALAGGLLAAGSACAQTTTPATPPTPATTNAPMHMPPPRFDMGTYLNLTDVEKPQVQPILDADRQQRMSAMQDSSLSVTDKRAKVKAIRADTNAKLQKILTPDQFAKWQRMQQPRMRRSMSPQPPVANTNAAPTHPAPAQ